MTIGMDELLRGADFRSLPASIQDNLNELHRRVNIIRAAYGKPLHVTSGFRDPARNSAAGGAIKSKHLIGCAVDFRDNAPHEFWNWCLTNLPLFVSTGLWLEDKRHTKTWLHVQIQAPRSGSRIFIPSSKTAPHPDIWSGEYDKSYDGFANSYEVND